MGQLFRQSMKFWLIAIAAVAIGVGAFLSIPVVSQVNAATPSDKPLDCQSCHNEIVLKSHDKLGKGNAACLTCHTNRMTDFHLVSGQDAIVAKSDYPVVCGQCHQDRYQSWVKGTHGVPLPDKGISEISTSDRVKCASCHNPHQPQIVLAGLTRPHPDATPPPPSIPYQPLAILGVLAVIITGLGVVIVMV